jgi:hypothetical protein
MHFRFSPVGDVMVGVADVAVAGAAGEVMVTLPPEAVLACDPQPGSKAVAARHVVPTRTPVRARHTRG